MSESRSAHLRAAFDDQIFVLQRTGGISRYFLNLMKSLREGGEAEILFPFRYSRSALLGSGHGMLKLPERPARVFVPAGYLLNASARRKLRGVRLLHRTYYHPRYLEARNETILVHTVHDMIPEIFPELFPGGNPHLAKANHLRSADLILCVSESTRQDLQRQLPDLTARVFVTPLGVSSKTFFPGPSTFSLSQPYVLYVGARSSYKDFGVLARAVAELDHEGLRLIAVGGGEFTAQELDELDDLGILGRTRQVSVTDEQLRRLYCSALAFVYPSRYEGFGLPTLEAMSSGCPVILANSSAHPEVGGDAALYFRPQDSHGLKSLLEALLESPQTRLDLIEAGRRRAREFSWEKTALSTLNAYREVADQRHT